MSKFDDKKKLIINNLRKASKNFRSTKQRVAKWTDEISYQENLSELGRRLWENYNENDVSLSAVKSVIDMSKAVLQQSQQIADDLQWSQIQDTVTTTTSATYMVGAISLSGYTPSPDQEKAIDSYIDLSRALEQRNQQPEISRRLKDIDESLGDEYDNAWRSLNTQLVDETRGPMFLIREVIKAGQWGRVLNCELYGSIPLHFQRNYK